MKVKLEVYSHRLFDEYMKDMGLNDENVENTNMAFISIIGTEECIKYWICENDKHYFKDHPNVLNLEFDDIQDDVLYNGHHFKSMHIEQAEKTVDFIENMFEKGVDTFILHCRAGYSRSRAVAEFIYRYCMEHDIIVDYSDRNEYSAFINDKVLRMLNNAYWKKHRLYYYEDGKTEYPRDLIDVLVKEIITEGSVENKKRGKI